MAEENDKTRQKIGLNAQLPQKLVTRMDDFIKSPVAGIRSRNHLVEIAVESFLEREEPIIHELEKARIRIQKKHSGGTK